MEEEDEVKEGGHQTKREKKTSKKKEGEMS